VGVLARAEKWIAPLLREKAVAGENPALLPLFETSLIYRVTQIKLLIKRKKKAELMKIVSKVQNRKTT